MVPHISCGMFLQLKGYPVQKSQVKGLFVEVGVYSEWNFSFYQRVHSTGRQDKMISAIDLY